MNDDNLIEQLAYNYVLAMSKNEFNPQAIANTNVLNDLGRESVINLLKMPIEEFCNLYRPFKVKDFVYKHDYFTPRNMYLIHPLYYTYYTYIVFKLAYIFSSKKDNFNFSRDHMKIFYSGLLDLQLSYKDVKENALYQKSYQLFQQEREKYKGKPALKIDIQDFFNSIKISNLMIKLKKVFGETEVIKDLNYFFKHCELESLPQFHYSIASSILSQFYLNEFDDKLQKLLIREELQLIRYVDDMYIIHLDGSEDRKKNNNILNEISYYLWSDSLVLNTSKTRMLSSNEFTSITDIFMSEYEDERSTFSAERIIEDKATEVIENSLLNDLIEELCRVEESHGIDLEKYKSLMSHYLSIKGDHVNKVLNNIIFSSKWKRMNPEDLKRLVDNWKYVLFNPNKFTVLYIMIYRYLEKGKVLNDSGYRIKRLLNYLFRSEMFTLRDTLIAISYLFQSNLKNLELLQRVEHMNPEYVQYIKTFISK